MFEHAFLGQVPLHRTSFHLPGPSLGYDTSMPKGLGQLSSECEMYQRFMQQVAQSIAYANKAAQQALAAGNYDAAGDWANHVNELSSEWAKWKKKYDECVQKMKLSPTIPTTPAVTSEPAGGMSYPITYPSFHSDTSAMPVTPPPPPPPPAPPVETPSIDKRQGMAPLQPGASEQGFQGGLPCPEGQYRPVGGGWCVPKPTTTAYNGIRTVPYGNLFSGGFFGGGQGVSATSFS